MSCCNNNRMDDLDPGARFSGMLSGTLEDGTAINFADMTGFALRFDLKLADAAETPYTFVARKGDAGVTVATDGLSVAFDVDAGLTAGREYEVRLLVWDDPSNPLRVGEPALLKVTDLPSPLTTGLS